MKREELLNWLEEEVVKYAFLQVTHPHLAQKITEKDKQAYQQIVALLKKEVTEKWIGEKARDLEDLVDFPFVTAKGLSERLKILKDFIRSLVEEASHDQNEQFLDEGPSRAEEGDK